VEQDWGIIMRFMMDIKSKGSKIKEFTLNMLK
jgi:hypothetical protein